MINYVNIAFGTDDGINFTSNHFGEAKFYLIYKLNLDNNEIELIEERNNNSISEEIHGDPKKAKSISELLKDISVLVGYVMGPNIVRIKKKFVVVISREKNIKESIEKIKKEKNKIKSELKKEGDKDIIYIQ